MSTFSVCCYSRYLSRWLYLLTGQVCRLLNIQQVLKVLVLLSQESRTEIPCHPSEKRERTLLSLSWKEKKQEKIEENYSSILRLSVNCPLVYLNKVKEEIPRIFGNRNPCLWYKIGKEGNAPVPLFQRNPVPSIKKALFLYQWRKEEHLIPSTKEKP